MDKDVFKVKGAEVIRRLKWALAQGNATRIRVRDEAGKTIVNIPVTLGVAGVVLAPLFSLLALVIGCAKEYTFEIERVDCED